MNRPDTTPCSVPGHRTGSKPYVVPVMGNNTRLVPIFVVYHGLDHLNVDGDVVIHPVHLTYAQASAAIAAHHAKENQS